MVKIKIKKPEFKIKPETRNFLISFIIVALITYALTYAEIWQLIIIPGIVGGLFNKTMRRGIYCGALGIFIVWISYLIYLMVAKNFYTNLDQFAGLIFGELGYGAIILILIILFGILFGALGGAIGSGIMILITPGLKKAITKVEKPYNSAKNTGNIKK
ncbi:MAG: hypothetical protein ACFFBF_09140 [Promethearchaeota archaeon]